MRRLLFTLCLLTLPASVYAQTHPCDQPAVLAYNVTAGESKTFSICQILLDTNGNPTTVTGVAQYDNNVRTLPPFTVGTTSSVSNKTLITVPYTVPNVVSTRTVQFAAISVKGESAKQPLPFVLTVSLPATVPVAPTGLSLQ